MMPSGRPIDTLDIGCPSCGATYTQGEAHRCLSVIDGTPPAIRPRSADSRPETWTEFNEYLEGSIIHERAYLSDELNYRADVQLEHRGALLAYERCHERIAHLVQAEADERAAEVEADRWKHAGIAGEPTTALMDRVRDGDR